MLKHCSEISRNYHHDSKNSKVWLSNMLSLLLFERDGQEKLLK